MTWVILQHCPQNLEPWTTDKDSLKKKKIIDVDLIYKVVSISPVQQSDSVIHIYMELNPEYSLEGLMLKLKLQYFGHMMRRANSLEKTLMLEKIESKRRRGWQRMRWLESITNSMYMNLSKLQETMEDRGVWHATVHAVTKSQTQLSD